MTICWKRDDPEKQSQTFQADSSQARVISHFSLIEIGIKSAVVIKLSQSLQKADVSKHKCMKPTAMIS